MFEFYRECIKMWLRWIKPTSPFIASLSFVAMVFGLILWLIAKFGDLPLLSEAIFFIVFLVGLLISVVMLVFVAPAKLWKQDKPLRELKQLQEANPRQYVFPYIRILNASAIVDAQEEFLSLSIFFPSALTKEVDLMRLNARLTMNGMSSLPLELGKVTLSNFYVSRLTDLKIPLTQQMLNLVRQSVKDNKTVKVMAKLWDADNQQFQWETEEWTTLLLTKLN